jgi:hypothetical protein
MNSLVPSRFWGICLATILFFLITSCITSASTATIESVINPINCILCRIITILWGITAAITTFVIVIAGIKWMGSMDDPGARAQAKTSIIHAIVGMVIVMIALQVVGWAVTNTQVSFDPLDFLPASAGGSGCDPFCNP